MKNKKFEMEKKLFTFSGQYCFFILNIKSNINNFIKKKRLRIKLIKYL